ncbi:MAG: N-6 DNA methylase, partial [Anaerolineae bacterium]|nr:N-6 DNA methylase [Anaerolineae bacterium]
MDPREIAELRKLTSFPALIAYLADRLDWPIQVGDARDIVFDYDPEELDLDPRYAVRIEAVKQIRPLVDTQPWGIFYIEFESKRLPVVVLRRILQALVPTSRSRHPERPAWALEDLLFVCSQGEPEYRSISFAHFRQAPGRLPELATFSWDCQESHFYYIKNLNLEALRWPADEGNIAAWQARWSAAFPTAHRAPITTAQELASRMAQLAAATRAMVNETYQVERESGPLHRLYDSFRRVLIHDLSVDDFADMYAQTVTYGLFSARATHSGEFSAAAVTALVPNTNPFLRDLLDECLKVGTGRRHTVHLDELGVDELVETLRETDIEAILREFGRQSREHKEDPVVHFYESFLREYDAEKKARRGVFYTPDPVVSFIVRSVDHLLRTEFACPDGLADTGTMEWQGQQVPRVQILDPATGTGTFLQHVIQQVYETFCERDRLPLAGRPARWNEYVARHLLPRLYGFELMMAPYAVAHMKLGLALRETGCDFSSDERLRVYLTNALQPAHEIPRTETPFLAKEAQEANRARMDTPITVVIGNPPYSGHSANTSRNPDGTLNFIGDLVQSYYYVDGKPLGERNPKWLQDDYVKFIRFAQWRIEQTGAGILAMITNHGYLDNPTFRGMRQQLMQTFSEIYVLDLHGNTKKKETAPDGSKDENVFDIQQG